MIYVLGDCHIGANRRNKVYAQKIRDVWAYILKDIVNKHREKYGDKEVITFVFAGDLWDNDNPRPNDLLCVKDTLNNIYRDTPNPINYIIIPGNHDRVGLDGVCPASVLKNEYLEDEFTLDKKIKIIERFDNDCFISNTYVQGNVKLYLIPYSGTLLSDLLEVKELVKNDDFVGKKILISHFTTIEQNRYAGIVSEDANVFDVYNCVVAGDCHICYDKGKFHTTGSSYMFNVDEMYSKNCVPSYIEIDQDTCRITRHTYPELKPVIIDNEDEAIDDNTMYLIVSNEPVTISKANVFLKYKPINLTESAGDDSIESIEVKSLNKDKIFNILYPELSDEERMRLRMYANGEMELIDVISGKAIQIINNTREDKFITEVELDAEMDGLVDKEDF